MWYTCSLYEGTSDRNKLLFQKKIQFKAGKEGVNWQNVQNKFERKYREHLSSGLLSIKDERGGGIGILFSGPAKYWYIKFDGKPIRVTEGGGFEIPEWSAWLPGIGDMTRFSRKRYAVTNLKLLRKSRTPKYGKRFSLVKVSVR